MEPHLNYPPDADLRKLLRFEPDSGAIWLGERRMVLLHTAALSALRRDLITSVGTEHTRRLLTRMGYASGAHDAGFAHKTRGNRSLEEMFMVGPQLHMLEGAARVTPLHLKMDAATGLYEGEFRWDDSWEAHAHRLAYGVVDEPACWILLGYASGYTSAFMGKLILFKEIKCGACGDDHCHIVGKPIDEW
ncbi:MAG: XylR N-terminal domain-containing protein, partial [Hydrogenophaga sp.]|nr:XylR N-terminal domain-containing protein [Hydrogenophaga sp.]